MKSPDDIASRSISSLCQLEGSRIICYFDTVASLFPILPQFTFLAAIHPSNTFQRLLKDEIEQNKLRTLHCMEFLNDIWSHVFNKVCMFYSSLKDGSVSLMDIDKLIKECSGDEKKIETEYRMLEEGISKCTNQAFDFMWIENCVQKTLQYQSLFQVANAARKIIDLKNVLGLSDDNFKSVTEIAEQVSI